MDGKNAVLCAVYGIMIPTNANSVWLAERLVSRDVTMVLTQAWMV
jgi:hypothetical protein